MKTIKSKSRMLVEQILNQSFLDANKTLTSLIFEAQEDRQNDIEQDQGEQLPEETDDTGEQGEDATEGDEEQIQTDALQDQPSNGSPNLGDSLDNSVQDASVSQGEVDQMTNDVVEINCEINQKIISKLYDKISNLKTTLTSNDMDHDSREYITLETKLSYYGNKLEQLQSKTNPAIDQEKVEQKIDIIDAALKTLQAQIGGSEVDDVDSTMEVDQKTQEQNVDQLGDNADSIEKQGEQEQKTESSEQEQTEQTEQTAESEQEQTEQK